MTDDGVPLVNVPRDLAAALDAHAELLRAGVVVWRDLGHVLGRPSPVHAPISLEATVAARNNPAWPDGVVHAAGSAAAQYVAALGQHALGLAELLSSRQVILPGWPIVRAQLELAGRVGWLLETGTPDGKRVTGEVRVARSHMEALAALCRRRLSLGVMKAKRSTIKQVKSERDVLRKRTENLFDDAVLDWNDPGDEEEWNLGGEAYAGLGQGVRIFSRIALSDNKGTYDTLSDFRTPIIAHADAAIEGTSA